MNTAQFRSNTVLLFGAVSVVFAVLLPFILLVSLHDVCSAYQQDAHAGDENAKSSDTNTVRTNDTSSATSKEGNPQEQPADIYRIASRWVCGWVTHPVDVFTYWIFLVTAFLAFYTYKLWASAVDQGNITQRIFMLDKRAFVYPTGVYGFSERDSPTDPYKWRFSVSITNSGETETQSLGILVECLVRNSVLPDGYDFTIHAPSVIGFVPPKFVLYTGSIPIISLPAITTNDMIDSQHGDKFIYLVGRILYFDVFPNTPMRVTSFCWLISCVGDLSAYDPSVVGTPPVAGTVAFRYLQHKEGNNTYDASDSTKESPPSLSK